MKVSVVMSCYNSEHVMRRAIDSILQQSLTDIELMLINDGSTDNTEEILTEYAAADPRVVIIKNKENIGLAASLNKGIQSAKSKYIARMDADDYSLPDRLEKQFSFLESHPEIDILGTAIIRMSKSGKRQGVSSLAADHQTISNSIWSKPAVYHPTIMVRKEVYSYAKYNPQIRWAEDADLWYRIYDQFTFHNLSDPLLEYTVKERLPLSKAKKNFYVKYDNLKKRGLVMRYSPQLLKDVLILSKNVVSSSL